MFAMFGLGWGEIIVLGIILMIMIAVPLAIIFVVMGASRGSKATGQGSEIAALRDEVARLRDENDRLRGAAENKGPPDSGIAAGPAS